MFRSHTSAQLADWLDRYRAIHLCAYASPYSCDCKFGAGPDDARGTFRGHFSEQTGCPEMREIVEDLRRLASLDEALAAPRCDIHTSLTPAAYLKTLPGNACSHGTAQPCTCED